MTGFRPAASCAPTATGDFATIKAAVGCVTGPDDTVFVKNGEYFESVDLRNLHGAQNHPIVIKAESHDTVIWGATKISTLFTTQLPAGTKN